MESALAGELGDTAGSNVCRCSFWVWQSRWPGLPWADWKMRKLGSISAGVRLASQRALYPGGRR